MKRIHHDRFFQPEFSTNKQTNKKFTIRYRFDSSLLFSYFSMLDTKNIEFFFLYFQLFFCVRKRERSSTIGHNNGTRDKKRYWIDNLMLFTFFLYDVSSNLQLIVKFSTRNLQKKNSSFLFFSGWIN